MSTLRISSLTSATSGFALILIMASVGLCIEPDKPTTDAGANSRAENAESQAVESRENFICGQDVFYQWKGTGMTETRPAPGSASNEGEIYETFVHTFEESGAPRDQVELRLSSRRQLFQSRAIERCHVERQTLSSCVEPKLRHIEQEYRVADFSARRVLLQSVIKDCRNIQGTCLGARLGPVTCRVQPAPPATGGNKDSAAAE